MLCSRIDDNFRVDISLLRENLLSCSNLLDTHNAIIVTDCYRQIPFDIRDILRHREIAGMSGEECVGKWSTACSLRVCRVVGELDGVQAAPAEACDADWQGGTFTFAKCSEKVCDPWPTQTEPVSVQEWNELAHGEEGVISLRQSDQWTLPLDF